MVSTRPAINNTNERPGDSVDGGQARVLLLEDLDERYRRTGETKYLEESIRIRREALSSIHSKDQNDKAIQSHLLSNHLCDRFAESENFDDLTEAIEFGLQALELTTEEQHVQRGAFLKRLKFLFEEKFEETDELADFDEIVRYQRLIVASTSAQDSNRLFNGLTALGSLLEQRSVITGQISNMDECVLVMERLLKMRPGDERAMKNLMHSLYSRYQQTADLSDLKDCIELRRQIKDSSNTDKSKVEWILTLARYLTILHEKTEDETHLEEAFAVANEALGTIDESRWESRWLSDLARMFGCQYLKTNALTDIDEAIRLGRLALKANPIEESREVILTNLGNRLGDRYLRTESEDDINEAIEYAREALQLDPESFSRLYNVAIKLGDRFTRTSNLRDVNEAIELERKALEKLPLDHSERVDYLNVLGNQLADRFHHKRDLNNLREAIQIAEQCLELLPKDHPHRASRLNNLAGRCLDLYNVKGNESDLTKSIAQYRVALNHEHSDTEDRIEAGQAIISNLGLVPNLVSWSHENSDRQFVLGRAVGLASDAAAAALRAGESAMTALKLLEQGRGIIGSSLKDIRSDVEDLEKHYPDLAERYRSLQTELDRSKMTNALSKESERSLNRRHAAAKDFIDLTAEIRRLPGYETFMLPPNDDEIYKASDCGPIVVINVSRLRCDALLISDSRVQALALSDLTLEGLEYQMSVRSFADPQTLEWLWDTIASPVLDVLGITEAPPADKWLRVWWIPTGPLVQMPLHAAGYHDLQSSKAVLDRVLSSYGSSIRNIIRGRRDAIQTSTFDKALLVAMEHTPGHDSLPFATGEIDLVSEIIRSMKLKPIVSERNKQAVARYLPECRIFHFAGHGLVHADNPSRSCLLLEDWETDSLKVSDLFDMNFQKGAPFLAYLSACGTGQTKDETSFDENISLIGACQIAGFRHVIGTLWSVQDDMSVRMASMTYQELSSSGISDESICRGLHKATCELRREWLERRGTGQGVASSTATELQDIAIELQFRSTRDALLVDSGDQNLGLAYWAPYVHYGV
ncbi:CHAT domain-containing protein [Fusarium flagelliforme]|uniref:CHAT domain-containing protein n=1 Tax=Fusarium flagelliforme TaxID=2675880 RepID=UPI001E8D78AF|nr:CHAT domain-containing protein [Fusarium flagelliforme]KAH7183206.1 CHAT domain-containing protein [Fusarium flagelliforme]